MREKKSILLIIFILIAFFRSLPAFTQAIYIGYSEVFSIGHKPHDYPSIIGYTDVFDMNTQGQYFMGYSGLFALNTNFVLLTAEFAANKTEVGVNETIQFVDLSSGVPAPESWAWNFGDGSVVDTVKNPTHSYSSPGTYHVSLTVTNPAGSQDDTLKNAYITVGTQTEGIKLQIVKTNPNPNAPPHIVKVGYYQTKYYVQKVLQTFDVNDGIVHIDDFPAQWNITNRFNDEIILFDLNNARIGYINFEYDPSNELGYRREAIIILHNDSSILADEAFPYNKNHPQNDKKWSYYQNGDYPVSMLIPPENTLAANYFKKPLLLIHGWEGEFVLKKNPNAVAEHNETSYWFTLPRQFEDHQQYDVWQFYYPYNSAHHHLAICMNYALEELKKRYQNHKIRIVTHSMGGLVTLRYLKDFSGDAVNMVEKVLFSAPPAHGSLGANLYYKTTASPILEALIPYDRHAPSVRDMKLGSDATWLIHQNKNLPDLNGSGSISDDYFVLLGTTYKWYTSDKKFQAFDRGLNGDLVPHSCLHPEAANHHDGIVAVSSGSLLDHGIGFATFHGNHNDAVHMQSYMRNEPSRQNIGSPTLMKSLIETYFGSTYSSFINQLSWNQHITAVVDGNRSVHKGGSNLGDLNTNNGVDYQKGIINLEFPQKSWITYQALYNNHVLDLHPKLQGGNIHYTGVFKRNNDSEGQKRYYFNDDQTLFKENEPDGRAITYNGCAIKIPEGPLTIIVRDVRGRPLYRKDTIFRYCETTNATLEYASRIIRDGEDNYTDTKEKLIASSGTIPADSLLTSFYVDDEAVWVDFNLSSLESALENFPVNLKLKLPDGSIADSTFLNSTYQHDTNLGLISMQITEPIPGTWHAWLESNHPGSDTLFYQALAFLQSSVFAYLPDSTENIAAQTQHTIKAGLKVDDFLLTENLKVFATIYRPDSQEEVYDVTANATTNDSSYIFSHDYYFDIPGEYLVKYNIDGKYNGFNFERCLHQLYISTDTVPLLIIQDIALRQNEPQRSLNLLQHTYNIDDYDTIYFSAEIISSNLSPEAFNAVMDSLSLFSYLSTNLSDTGTVLMRYYCHFDENTVTDTVQIRILLPELSFVTAQVNESSIITPSEISLNYSIKNTGNVDCGAYEVRYYITQETVLLPTDYCIGSLTVPHHSVESVIQISDVVSVPVLPLKGDYYLMIVADATNLIVELDETNNTVVFPVSVNPPPVPPIIIAANAGDGEVNLIWTPNNQPGITGYAIHYGTDTTGVLNKVFLYNPDTTYTIAELVNGNTYFFALSCYRTLGNESALSAFVSSTPNDISVLLPLTGVTLTSDADTCFAATQSIIVSDLIIETNASVRLIAGENIQLLPSTKVHSGAQFHAYIDSTGNYCQQPESMIAAFDDDIEEARKEWPATIKDNDDRFFRVFPNPTKGTFTLELLDYEDPSIISIEIYNMLGSKILSTELPAQPQYNFSLAGQQQGIYLVRVMKGNDVGVMKLIKQ